MATEERMSSNTKFPLGKSKDRQKEEGVGGAGAPTSDYRQGRTSALPEDCQEILRNTDKDFKNTKRGNY